MKNRNWLLLGTLALSSIAFAEGGRETGNGGDVVYCTDNGVQRVRMLDEVEGEGFFGTPQGAIPGTTVREKVDFVLNNLRLKGTEDLADELQNSTQDFVSDIAQYKKGVPFKGKVTNFLPGSVFHAPDSDYRYLPKNCKAPVGLIDQKMPEKPEERRFTISMDHFDQLNDDSIARAVLHEGWFMRQLALKETTSVNARYLNSLSSSQGFTEMGICDWLNRLHISKSAADISFKQIAPIDSVVKAFVMRADGIFACYPNGNLKSYQGNFEANANFFSKVNAVLKEFTDNKVYVQITINFSDGKIPTYVSAQASLNPQTHSGSISTWYYPTEKPYLNFLVEETNMKDQRPATGKSGLVFLRSQQNSSTDARIEGTIDFKYRYRWGGAFKRSSGEVSATYSLSISKMYADQEPFSINFYF